MTDLYTAALCLLFRNAVLEDTRVFGNDLSPHTLSVAFDFRVSERHSDVRKPLSTVQHI